VSAAPVPALRLWSTRKEDKPNKDKEASGGTTSPPCPPGAHWIVIILSTFCNLFVQGSHNPCFLP
jgi:hypothetical protein